jgi:release factor glutamine methyltransferase
VTAKEAIQLAAAYLTERGLKFPQQDAELLVISVLQCDRAFLYAHPEAQLSPSKESLFHQWLSRRGEHYPLQYLRGKQEFYGRKFLVGPAVFIPRPETELLVEISLTLLRGIPAERVFAAEVGSGSGCIAVTLACEEPRLVIAATDVSAEALKVARHNARVHKCVERIDFYQGNTLDPVRERQGHYHLVVSNPPYVSIQAKNEVELSVREYEPGGAVFSGDSGQEVYVQLFEQAKLLLRPQGSLVVELGYGTRQAVCRLGQQKGWLLRQVHNDLAGIERCAVFQPKQ